MIACKRTALPLIVAASPRVAGLLAFEKPDAATVRTSCGGGVSAE
jgi:hypothetical protein